MEMSARDEGPVYYREIQKNAYLKRIPNDVGGSKLRPLGHNKKPPLKPMWTLFCVHNGRTPFLEQYPEAESPATLSHKPAWRACLRAARHVTASVKPHVGDEYDFLVDTDHGPVRMLAPDWESMQDWVTTLRSKLHELKILSKGENVYCAPPAAPPPRAAARDPTSPLPPTPPVPPDRVPGIELLTPIVQPTVPEPPTEPEPVIEPEAQTDNAETVTEAIDISSWDTAYSPLPSTSQEPKIEPSKSVAKICGQNICLDDSILKRTAASTESDEEFFSEIDRIHDEVSGDEGYGRQEYTQRLLVNDEEKPGSSHCGGDGSDRQATNITVIQVSNKPPHTAIPVMGSETDVFDFNFKQHLSLTPQNQTENPNSFVNIVNTEVNVQNPIENGYGTVFDKDSDYGHLSLTTTVNLTGDVKTDATEGLYERLCLASTSVASPLPVRKIKNLDKIRKSSLPNLDTASESAYEYLFPNFSHNRNNNSNITNTTLNSTGNDMEEREEINSNINTRNERHNSNDSRNNISDNSRSNITNSDTSRSNITNISDNSRSNITNISDNSRSITTNSDNSRSNITNISDNSRSNITNVSDNSRSNITNPSGISRSNITNDRVHMNVTNSVSVGNDSNSRTIRSNVERSHSQNAYDTSPRQRENLIRRVQNNSPKRDVKNDKSDAPKPIWRRGLTELSLLSRLRGIGQGKRHESPTRHEEQSDRSITSPANVVHRSRPEARVDGTRRRSSSLSNGQSPPTSLAPCPALQPLRARQAAALRAEQRRGAALATTVSTRDTKVFCDYNGHVWIAWWSLGGARCCGRAGDRVAALRGTTPKNAQHARQLLKSSPTHTVDILLHRVPLGKIYVLNKRDLESIGIKLDSECNIVHVSVQSAAARAGLPPAGRWAVTEVNNRPINLIKGGEEEMNRLSAHGSEVSVLIQPSALVKKIRAAVKQDSAFYQIRSILHSFH